MRKLIQVATKLWLEKNGPVQLEKWALRALNQVAILPSDPGDVLKGVY